MKNIKFIIGLIVLTIFIGCTADTNDVDLDSLDAPTNVSALATVSQDNSGNVTLTPRGEGATQYEIYFGDGSAEGATLKPGETVLHKYAEGIYQVKIIGSTLNGKKTEVSQELTVSFKAPENLVVNISNDSSISKQVNVTANADFAMFFEVYFGEPGNDDPVVANIGETASYVYKQAGKYTIRVVAKSAAIKTTEYTQEFEAKTINGPTVAAPTPANNAADVIAIYSNKYTPIAISEWNPGWGQTTVLTDVLIAGNNTLKYSALNYTGIVTDYGNPTNLSAMKYVHFDYWTSDAKTLSLKLVNTNVGKEDIKAVSTITTGAWTGVDILLSSYNTDLSAISQIIFESSGATVYIDNLYFYKNSTLASAPITAAPTPTVDSKNVISIYSNAYTPLAISEWNPGWGQTTVLTDQLIAGNNTLKYTNLNYTGIVTNYDNPTNLSGMTHVHFDYWSNDAKSLSLKLVNTKLGKEDIKSVSTVTLGAWTGVDILLSNYNTDLSAISQIIFESSDATVYIDNLYFYKSSTSGGGASGVAPFSPINFESGGYGANWTWAVFENGSNAPIEFVSNPNTSGINSSSKVAKITALKAGQPWVGCESKHGTDIGSFKFDSTNKIVRIMVYKTVISDVGIKFAEANGDAQPEVKVANTKINQWEELTFDLSGSIGKGATGVIDQIIIFPDFNLNGRAQDNVVYFDNITFSSN